MIFAQDLGRSFLQASIYNFCISMKCREIPIFGSVWMYTLSSFRIAVFELSGNGEDAFFFFCLFHPTLLDSVPASAVAVLCAKNEKDENQTEMIKRKGERRLEKKAIFDRRSVEFLSKKVLLLRIYRIHFYLISYLEPSWHSL